MKIIEFFGGPGSGKTTAASYCFSYFKRRGVECEFTREYAQEAIYAQQRYQLSSQFIVCANQYRKYTEQAEAGTQLLFSDTSLLLSQVYGAHHEANALLVPLLKHLYRDFETIKVFVKRRKEFRTQGRIHNEAQSRELDILMRSKLGPFDYEIDGDEVGTEMFAARLYADLTKGTYE